MSIMPENYAEIVPYSTFKLLQSIWQSRERLKAIPRMTFAIGQHSFVGTLVNIDFKNEPYPFVMKVNLSDNGSAGQLLYADLRSLSWLIVHDASDYVETLSDGKLDNIGSESNVGRLSINRKAEALSDWIASTIGVKTIVTISWENIEESKRRSLSVIDLLLDSLSECLRQTLCDSFAKDAFRKVVKKIVVGIGSIKSFTVHGDTLTIIVSDEQGTAGQYHLSEISKNLNEIL